MEYVDVICTTIQLLKSSWASIQDWYNYNKLLDEKLQTLRRNMEELGSREKVLNGDLHNSEYELGKKPKREVENWLKEVKAKATEVEEVEQKSKKRRYLWRSRFLRLVDEKINDVNKLLGVPDQRGEALLTMPLVGQTTSKRNLEKIWNCLLNDEITRIGVYGMGGVGKTTIAIHIQNRLLKNPSSIDHVYWVTVSQESSIYKLQNEIAKYIGLDLSNEDDERKRAAKLFNALRGGKRFVVLLDDMWEVYDPKDIGIPVGINEGRLLITSRSLEVCRGMQCEQPIKIDPLSSEEAWELFIKNVADDKVLDQHVEDIQRSIAMECAGLPLAIVAIARSMRGVDDIHDWRSALYELRESAKGLIDMEDQVFKILKFSYDRLNDKILQQCLLYCALFPEDYNIPKVELIVLWIAEGLLDDRGNRQAQYDRGYSILNQLQNVCLLERADVNSRGCICVKMHDVIRDMALNITKENGPPIFMVKSGPRLFQIPNEGGWSENLERVFLQDEIIEDYLSPSISPNCPRLLTLLLQYNWCKELPDSFFVHVHCLRVLKLHHMLFLKRLPSSISNLKSLRGLFLCHCPSLEYVPSLAELKELRELHLCGSGVKALPEGLNGLVNLKCLNLFGAFQIQSIPTGLLMRLPHLQCLRLDNLRGIDVQIEELISLRQLEILGVNFSDPYMFNRYASTKVWQRLSHYRLQMVEVGEGGSVDMLRCREITICGLGHEINSIVLPTNTQRLKIYHCLLPPSLLDLSPSLKENACRDLQLCQIENNVGVEHLWSFTTMTSSLPVNLKILVVENLLDLTCLFKYDGFEMVGRPPAATPESGTFSFLKHLSVAGCGKLKYLLTACLVRYHLQNLELIRVGSCLEMEHIIIEEEGITTEGNYILTFPKLRCLFLDANPELKSICMGTKTMVCPSIQNIRVNSCAKLKSLSLPTVNVGYSRTTSETQLSSLIKIRGQKEWWDLLEWDNPQAKYVPQASFSDVEGRLDEYEPIKFGRPSWEALDEVM